MRDARYSVWRRISKSLLPSRPPDTPSQPPHSMPHPPGSIPLRTSDLSPLLLLSVPKPLSATRTVLLVLDLLCDLVEPDLLGDTLPPRGILGTACVLENSVNLFERLALELGEEEPGLEESDDTESHEDEVGAVAANSNCPEHDGRGESDGEIHDPVDGG